MKVAVRRLEVEVALRAARAHPLELGPRALESRTPFVVCTLERQPEHVGLEQHPRRVDVLHLGRRDLRDPSPALGPERDQSLAGEGANGLAKRRRADVPLLGQLLDADARAGLQLARDDRRAQALLGPFRAGGAHHWNPIRKICRFLETSNRRSE